VVVDHVADIYAGGRHRPGLHAAFAHLDATAVLSRDIASL
jgi:F0F1-type ATP synthase beta subunit